MIICSSSTEVRNISFVSSWGSYNVVMWRSEWNMAQSQTNHLSFLWMGSGWVKMQWSVVVMVTMVIIQLVVGYHGNYSLPSNIKSLVYLQAWFYWQWQTLSQIPLRLVWSEGQHSSQDYLIRVTIPLSVLTSNSRNWLENNNQHSNVFMLIKPMFPYFVFSSYLLHFIYLWIFWNLHFAITLVYFL